MYQVLNKKLTKRVISKTANHFFRIILLYAAIYLVEMNFNLQLNCKYLYVNLKTKHRRSVKTISAYCKSQSPKYNFSEISSFFLPTSFIIYLVSPED